MCVVGVKKKIVLTMVLRLDEYNGRFGKACSALIGHGTRDIACHAP
jgi:hypothetical protein